MTVVKSVYSAVRNDSLYKIDYVPSLKGSQGFKLLPSNQNTQDLKNEYIQSHLSIYLPTQPHLLFTEDTACYFNTQLLSTTWKRIYNLFLKQRILFWIFVCVCIYICTYICMSKILLLLLLLLLQLALQPLVGFGRFYDFVPQSSIFILLSPISHFHLL